MGARRVIILSLFFSLLHQREAVLRQEYDNSYEQAQNYIRHSADVTRQLKYMAENRLTGSLSGLDMLDGNPAPN